MDDVLDVAGLDESPAAPAAAGAAAVATATGHDESLGGETTFSDSSVSQFDFEVYKGRKGVADRLAIMNPLNLKWHRVHFDQTKKSYILCNSRFKKVGQGEVIEGKPALCCQRMEQAKKRFGAFIVQYGTAPDGKLLSPLSYTMRLWRFSESLFVQLRDVNAEFPLDKHDLIVRCTDESFQKMTISAARESVIRMDKPQLQKAKAEVDEWVKGMLPKVFKSLGTKLTEQQLAERLGLAASARTTVQETVVADIGDLLPSE